MNRTLALTLIALALLAFLPAQAADVVEYADEDGTIQTAQILTVQKETEKDFRAQVFLGARKRTLSIPSRNVISLRRGDPDAKNLWSKQLHRGKQLYATGQLATENNVPGAEEVFAKVAYTMEKGTPGQEDYEKVEPWHNMYATFYLIETRYKLGQAGGKEKFQQALANVDEFKKRSEGRYEKQMEMEVPAQEGMRKGKVYGWGSSRLLPDVLLYEARCHAALGDNAKAIAIYDGIIDEGKKGDLSPITLTTAFIEKADLEAQGKQADQQENIFRSVGTTLASLARTQKDAFGRDVLSRAANRALLRGADLLLESAAQGSVSYDVPLQRYRALKAGEGTRDEALYIGAQSGIGICLTEKGEGEEAYKALLEVVVGGGAYPALLDRALYYLGRAAKLFADEIDRAGGNGAFLREEAGRWWADLRARYPASEWAKKAQGS